MIYQLVYLYCYHGTLGMIRLKHVINMSFKSWWFYVSV